VRVIAGDLQAMKTTITRTVTIRLYYPSFYLLVMLVILLLSEGGR
jgi:hypothetical protein